MKKLDLNYIKNYPDTFSKGDLTFTRLNDIAIIAEEGKKMENALSTHAHFFLGEEEGAIYTVDHTDGTHLNIGVKPSGKVWNIVLKRNARPEQELRTQIIKTFAEEFAKSPQAKLAASLPKNEPEMEP